jgi:hypothetical protein
VSLLDSITSLATGTYTVTRRAAGTYVNGRYVKGPVTATLQVVAVEMPAFNMNRIIAGRDLKHDDQGQYATSLRVLYTIDELYTRRAGFDPDEVQIDGSTWTVTRVEKWDHTGRVHYRVIVSEKLDGAA